MSDTHKAAIVTTTERGEVQRMHPLVGAAMASGEVNPETLRELLAVQREWEAGEARKAYTRAMAGLKADLPRVIGHDKSVDFAPRNGPKVHYTHTSLAHVVEEVVGILTAHGFSHSWIPRTTDRKVEVTCRLTHTEGHSEECTLDAEPDKSGMKSGPQAIASTITQLQRYSLLALLGLATADMGEPTAQAEERPAEHEHVDPRRNMAAVRAIVKAGLTKEDAEAHVQRDVSAWTSADLRELRSWLAAHRGGADD
ncbi:MAG: ERF family protein [Sandaracinaceae bacterium]